MSEWINVSVTWSLGVYHTHTPSVIILGYMLPFIVNASEFTMRTIKEYRDDLSNRAKCVRERLEYNKLKNMPYPSTYIPKLTLGHILARIIGTVTPIVNAIVCICNMDRVFDWIGSVFDWFGKVFSMPLVPNRDK